MAHKALAKALGKGKGKGDDSDERKGQGKGIMDKFDDDPFFKGLAGKVTRHEPLAAGHPCDICGKTCTAHPRCPQNTACSHGLRVVGADGRYSCSIHEWGGGATSVECRW